MIYVIGGIIFILCSTPVVLMLINSLRIPDKLKKAEELLEQGMLNESADIVRSVLEKHKDNVRARYVRAQILMEQKQYLLAISELNGILTVSDFRAHVGELDVHYHLAEMYKATNNFPKEIEEYRVILAFEPENAEANMRMGMAMYNKHTYPKAQEYLLKAVTNGPQPSPYLLPLGISMFFNGDYEKSEHFLLESLENDTNNVEAKFYLGSIYKLQKNYDRAINMFMQSKGDNDFHVQSLRMLGEIYFDQEHYEEVIECLEPGIDKLHDSTKEGLTYRYLLAESYEIKSRIKDAIAIWESIYKINPDFRDVKNKVNIYRNIGNNQHIMELLSMNPEELQEYVNEIISVFNYTIISKERISVNEYLYKTFNSKRMGDPPVLIFFNRAVSEVTERNLNELDKRMVSGKFKKGLYITTSSFNMKAQNEATSKQIELYDGGFVNKAIEKIKAKQSLGKKQ